MWPKGNPYFLQPQEVLESDTGSKRVNSCTHNKKTGMTREIIKGILLKKTNISDI